MVINRTLRIALLLSVGVHVAGMSAVSIITPTGLDRIKSFTQVDFLGPILEKTAFDIMIENVDPVFSTSYGDAFENITNAYLKVATPKRKFSGERYSAYLEVVTGRGVFDFLSGTKTIPDFLLSPAMAYPIRINGGRRESGKTGREVVHKPMQPLILRGLYGDESGYAIKLKVLTDEGGSVRLVDPLTTTGYPQLDLKAAEYVKTWIFAPAGEGSPVEEWVEVEIFLETGEK